MYPKTNDYYPPPPPPIMTPPPSAPFYHQPPPPPLGMHPHGPVPWSTGLCDCTDDCGNCCMTCFCPCVTYGRVAEIVDRGSTSCGAAGALYALLEWFTCCHCVYSCFNRKKMRAQYSLAETPCGDFCVHCCCEPCALCQEYRELKNRGFDMTVGWQINAARQAVLTTVPPPLTGGMMR